jgi:TRAP-type C4-dicarboxylate transport system substrate-binding protein
MRALLAGMVFAVAVGLLLAPAGVAADTFRLTIGAGHPVDASAWITSMRDYLQVEVKKRVESRTPHKIEWVEAYGGSIAKLGEVLEAIESGLMDIGDVHIPFEPAKLMAHNFPYFVPFASPDPLLATKAAYKVYQDHPPLREALEKKYNQVFLGVGAVTCYNLVTTFPWERVDQLKGRKIAAAGPNIPWVQAIGAVGVQSNLNEAYTSMQTGVYQGWVMHAQATVSFKLHEVAKHYTVTDFQATPNVLLTMNRDTWRKLPKPVQDIFTEVASQYHIVQTPLAMAKDEAAFKTMKEAGSTVRTLSWEEKVKWANAIPDIPKARAEEISKGGMPGDVVKAYYMNQKAAGFKFPREWFR